LSIIIAFKEDEDEDEQIYEILAQIAKKKYSYDTEFVNFQEKFYQTFMNTNFITNSVIAIIMKKL
jgi:hypothetical protein